MRRQYVGVIVGVLRTLQHRCRRHPLGAGGQASGCFLSAEGILSFNFPGPGVYQVGGSGVLVEGRGDCLLSSYGG